MQTLLETQTGLKPKTCSKCGKTKYLPVDFYKNAAQPGGFSNNCKTCQNEYLKARRVASIPSSPAPTTQKTTDVETLQSITRVATLLVGKGMHAKDALDVASEIVLHGHTLKSL